MRKIILLISLLLISCTGTSEKQAAQNECAEGNGEGCRKLGKIFEDAGDLVRAKDNYELSCKMTNTQGCMRLGEMLLKDGAGEEAKAKFKYACDRGNTTGCSRYAEILTGK